MISFTSLVTALLQRALGNSSVSDVTSVRHSRTEKRQNQIHFFAFPNPLVSDEFDQHVARSS